MKFRYLLPMNPESFDDVLPLGPTHLLDPRLRETSAYYPYALLPYPAWKGKATRFGDDVFLFADSGGYDLLWNPNKPIYPQAVVDWQIKNASAGVILDLPPYADRLKQCPLGWREALRRTLRNVKLGLPIYLDARAQGSQFGWWGALQGRTSEEMEEWFGRVSEIYPFTDEREGWGLKAHPPTHAVPVARKLGFARDHQLKRIHLLGSGGNRTLALIACLGPLAGLEYVSVDCTAPSEAYSKNGRFLVETKGGLGFKADSEWAPPPKGCDCTGCHLIREESEGGVDRELANTALPFRRAQHNLLLCLRTYERLAREAVGADPTAFLGEVFDKDYASRVPDIMRAFEA